MQKYGVKKGQVYESADGAGYRVMVVDDTTYADCDDVVVEELPSGKTRRIDTFKLAMVRYKLITVR